MFLPPPIIPEVEDSTPSPVSEASSGYISTSLSTATLSDVYTLSWDLPPPASSRADGFEAVPDEEEEDDKVTHPESFRVDQSGPQESLLVTDVKAAEERTDSPPSKPDDTPSDSNLSQQEPDLSPSVQLEKQGASNSAADPDLPCQTEQKEISTAEHLESEQLDNLEPLKDSLLVQENETEQTEVSQTDNSKPEIPPVELELEGQDESETTVPQPQQPEQDQTTLASDQDPNQDLIPFVPEVLVPAPASSGDTVPQESSKEQTNSEDSGTSVHLQVQQEEPANVSTKAATSPDPSLSSVHPPKAVANPFKIQKVKSSDLKSFQRILGEEEDKPTQVDSTSSSTGAGLNLSVPMESLEIISDSEEGDAATTVLPDWLKEGEFVTVGSNKSGTVRYVGPTDFAKGTWVGVELEVPAGEWNSAQFCYFLMHLTSLHSSLSIST